MIGGKSPVNFLVVGAGSRGHAYAQAVGTTSAADSARIAAVAEPDRFKRNEFGQQFIWGQDGFPGNGQDFTCWTEWIAWEDRRRAGANVSSSDSLSQNGGQAVSDKVVIITGVFICTLDESHAEILSALARFNLHVLCEKPLALSLDDCLSIHAAYRSQKPTKIFSIGHVLRYSPHNMLLRRLLREDRVIGDALSLEHTEPVGWWHFSHSYVRGSWRKETGQGVGTLLTKSCHDIDFILWLLSSEAGTVDHNVVPHLPSKISSTGHLSYFKKGRKPDEAGTATNCLKCPLGDEGCAYSAKKIYRDKWLWDKKDTGWPLKVVLPEIEDLVKTSGWEMAERALMRKLAEDYDDETPEEIVRERGWYGRCVYEAGNDVVDDQTVILSWNEEDGQTSQSHSPPKGAEAGSASPTTVTSRIRAPKTALFHLAYATAAQCERRGRIYGTAGEISYDSKRISVYTFADEKTVEHVLPTPSTKLERNHGGGDLGLTKSFVSAVITTEEGTMTPQDAQWKYVGGDLEEIVRSHAAVFRAEEARSSGSVLEFEQWWKDLIGKGKVDL